MACQWPWLQLVAALLTAAALCDLCAHTRAAAPGRPAAGTAQAGPGVDYDAVIAQSHAAAANNRVELLGTWAWAPDQGSSAQQCPDGPNDICHASKCRHCGCHGGPNAIDCPPKIRPASPQIYANCPNQVQREAGLDVYDECGVRITGRVALPFRSVICAPGTCSRNNPGL